MLVRYDFRIIGKFNLELNLQKTTHKYIQKKRGGKIFKQQKNT